MQIEIQKRTPKPKLSIGTKCKRKYKRKLTCWRNIVNEAFSKENIWRYFVNQPSSRLRFHPQRDIVNRFPQGQMIHTNKYSTQFYQFLGFIYKRYQFGLQIGFKWLRIKSIADQNTFDNTQCHRSAVFFVVRLRQRSGPSRKMNFPRAITRIASRNPLPPFVIITPPYLSLFVIINCIAERM